MRDGISNEDAFWPDLDLSDSPIVEVRRSLCRGEISSNFTSDTSVEQSAYNSRGMCVPAEP
ncbi:hypothetical protein T11_9157 [Trichinella zimbabwensis]|uniref:Uncharacterized protein n=1 Tax=Trichinella zimbabwensis TaxID=268475 RepID=A0A0V1GRU8_9BILA|nr:hypothetical protein T11_9157 [Trichinella zimbabwensis]